jgi:NAD kinase
MQPSFEKIAFVASDMPEAATALERLSAMYGSVPAKQADAIVALGGDGLMLQTLHRHMHDRQTYQAAKLRIWVDGRMRLEELICDGVLVSTPAGSTAYNLSVNGPILPINAPLLALTPISAFRPRRWHGALLPKEARIRLDVLEADKRPVSAVADHFETRDVVRVDVAEAAHIDLFMMFDPGHNLDERVLAEQFRY